MISKNYLKHYNFFIFYFSSHLNVKLIQKNNTEMNVNMHICKAACSSQTIFPSSLFP